MYQVINECSIESIIEKLSNKILGIRDSILEVAKEFVLYCKNYPELKDKLIDIGHSRTTLNMLEKVGNGTLYEGYFFESGCQYRAIERLPISEQQKYASKPLLVATVSGNHLLVDLKNLTPSQVKQVFAYDHIRSEEEQRAYIESQKTEAVVKAVVNSSEKPKYVIDGKGIVTKGGDRLELSELLEAVRKITKA